MALLVSGIPFEWLFESFYLQNNKNKRYKRGDKPNPVATVSIPHIKGISERTRPYISQADICVAFKNKIIVRSLLMRINKRNPLTEYKGGFTRYHAETANRYI